MTETQIQTIVESVAALGTPTPELWEACYYCANTTIRARAIVDPAKTRDDDVQEAVIHLIGKALIYNVSKNDCAEAYLRDKANAFASRTHNRKIRHKDVAKKFTDYCVGREFNEDEENPMAEGLSEHAAFVYHQRIQNRIQGHANKVAKGIRV